MAQPVVQRREMNGEVGAQRRSRSDGALNEDAPQFFGLVRGEHDENGEQTPKMMEQQHGSDLGQHQRFNSKKSDEETGTDTAQTLAPGGKEKVVAEVEQREDNNGCNKVKDLSEHSGGT